MSSRISQINTQEIGTSSNINRKSYKPKGSGGYAKLYSWLAKNNIDIDYGSSEFDLVANLSKQITGQFIDPTPELLEIIDEIFEEEKED